MSGNSLYCPEERCSANLGGYCGIRGKRLMSMAAAAGNPMSNSNFIGNGALGGAVFFNDVGPEGQPPMTEDWGFWRNCPFAKNLSRRK